MLTEFKLIKSSKFTLPEGDKKSCSASFLPGSLPFVSFFPAAPSHPGCFLLLPDFPRTLESHSTSSVLCALGASLCLHVGGDCGREKEEPENGGTSHSSALPS